jgi:hypothetical protein
VNKHSFEKFNYKTTFGNKDFDGMAGTLLGGVWIA